jgi:hypothetical protein
MGSRPEGQQDSLRALPRSLAASSAQVGGATPGAWAGLRASCVLPPSTRAASCAASSHALKTGIPSWCWVWSGC